jgi:hypothetical protein
LEAYVERRPKFADKFAVLSRNSDTMTGFGRHVIFSVFKPRELKRYTDGQIRQIAAG